MNLNKVFCIECKWIGNNRYSKELVCLHPRMVEIVETPIRRDEISRVGNPNEINKYNDCMYYYETPFEVDVTRGLKEWFKRYCDENDLVVDITSRDTVGDEDNDK